MSPLVSTATVSTEVGSGSLMVDSDDEPFAQDVPTTARAKKNAAILEARNRNRSIGIPTLQAVPSLSHRSVGKPSMSDRR